MNIAMALMLIAGIANQSYCMHQVGCFRWNCNDFTSSAVLLLRANNFTAYPACGWLRHGRHAWVRVEIGNITFDIEPQEAKIVESRYVLDVFDRLNYTGYVFSGRCVVRGVV